MRPTRLMIAAVLLIIASSSSCKKETPETPPDTSIPQASLYGKWIMTAYVHNNEDAFNNGQISACVKDDTVSFSKSNIATNEEGPTKCAASDPQTKSGPYVYKAEQKTLAITTDGIERQATVMTLDATTLKIRQTDNNDVITYTRLSTDTIIIVKYIDWSGIWKMDLKLEAEGGPCDETMLEDEAHIPPTFTFSEGDKTIDFKTDPVGSNLNSSDFTNTYSFFNDTLKIQSHYNDGSEIMNFDAVLTYNYSTKKFSGMYANEWNTGLKCTNTLVIEREEK